MHWQPQLVLEQAPFLLPRYSHLRKEILQQDLTLQTRHVAPSKRWVLPPSWLVPLNQGALYRRLWPPSLALRLCEHIWHPAARFGMCWTQSLHLRVQVVTTLWGHPSWRIDARGANAEQNTAATLKSFPKVLTGQLLEYFPVGRPPSAKTQKVNHPPYGGFEPTQSLTARPEPSKGSVVTSPVRGPGRGRYR